MAFTRFLCSVFQNMFSGASEHQAARAGEGEGGDHGGPSAMSLMARNYLDW